MKVYNSGDFIMKEKEIINGYISILKEKEIDRKWIPNFIEEIGEDTVLACIKELKTKLVPSEFVQEIFDFEKKGNGNIL